LSPAEPVPSPGSAMPSLSDQVVAGGLFDSMFTTDEMSDVTSDASWIRAMLDFEAALATAEGRLGVIPPAAAEEIALSCRHEKFDPVALGRAARLGANPAIPLVKQLRERVPEDNSQWVHFGSTSQDVLDTALVLVVGAGSRLILGYLDKLAAAAAGLAELHRSTPMAARTMLQQALPTTFGAKVSAWLVATLEATRSLDAAVGRFSDVQLGGAAGTLAALGNVGPRVVEAVASDLALGVPVLPWHTDRTRVVGIANALAVCAGVAGKVANDVALLMQTEVREVSEPAASGRGASSALPHKRNPAMAAVVGASWHRAQGLAGTVLGCMVQENERAVGAWQAELQSVNGLLQVTAGAVATAAEMLAGLEVDPSRMSENLKVTQGLVLSERVTIELAKQLGYRQAAKVVAESSARASASSTSLEDELWSDPVVAPVKVRLPADLFVPAGWLGSAETFVDRALKLYRDRSSDMHGGPPVGEV
jgi:3-carboxy-cis,cis-muconate cycloisomerase